jgi:hypothetical protein
MSFSLSPWRESLRMYPHFRRIAKDRASTRLKKPKAFLEKRFVIFHERPRPAE